MLVVVFSKMPTLSFSAIIAGKNAFAAVVVTVGLLAAILSTLDTSTNVASHAVQKLSPFSKFPASIVQVFLLLLSGTIFIFFQTVLSLILFALFLYMAGPALTFVGIYSGIHPRTCALVGASFASLQAFFHFRGGRLFDLEVIPDMLPLSNPLHMGIVLLVTQTLLLVSIGIKRRYK